MNDLDYENDEERHHFTCECKSMDHTYVFNLYKESYDAALFKVSLMSLVNLNDVKTYSLNELLLPENKESKKRKNK